MVSLPVDFLAMACPAVLLGSRGKEVRRKLGCSLTFPIGGQDADKKNPGGLHKKAHPDAAHGFKQFLRVIFSTRQFDPGDNAYVQ